MRLDLADLENDSSKPCNFQIVGSRQLGESVQIPVGNVRLPQISGNLVLLLYHLPLVFREAGASFADVDSVSTPGELFIRASSSANSAVVSHWLVCFVQVD
jgi:hypothetical protein